MENLISNLQDEPLALVLIAVLALAIALLFIPPAFFNYLKSFKLPTIKAREESAKKQGQSSAKIYLKLNLNFKNLKIRSPKVFAAIVIVLVALFSSGYFVYDFYFRPVRVVSAWQFKLERGGAIKKLQEGGLAAWPEAKVYLLDVRSREDYAKDHLVGSESLPANRAKVEYLPIEDVPIVIYSSKFGFILAREAADAIAKNGASEKINYKNPGKIYVIKDGFEGLKKTGLKTESGEWD